MRLFTRKCVEWETPSGRFEFETDGEHARLLTPSGQILELDANDWKQLAAAISRTAASAEDRPLNAGAPWSAELDAELASHWSAGKGVKYIAEKMGRTSGSISSRLVKLDILENREQAFEEPR